MDGYSIALLADHPHLIPAVGEMRWKEWGHPPEPEKLEWWVEVTGKESGHNALPMTWVAIDSLGQAMGAVGLGQFDIEERHDRSPWILGLIVTPHHRGKDIGGQLLKALEVWTYQHGYPRVWVATGNHALGFYQKCGWELAEVIHRPSDETVFVLTKSLSGI